MSKSRTRLTCNYDPFSFGVPVRLDPGICGMVEALKRHEHMRQWRRQLESLESLYG